MANYAVCEISGKQVKVVPNVPFETDLQKSEEVVAKVLMLSEDGKVTLGKPFLKDLKLKVLGPGFQEKIRVAKYHSKANYRRVTGSRKKIINVVWES
jgi:ribosomal protein L21